MKEFQSSEAEENVAESFVLGVDVGGTGIKASLVATATGEMTAERRRVPTPHPATPDAVTRAVAELANGFDWRGPVGVGFPGVIRQGRVETAANLDASWIGVDAAPLLSERLDGHPVAVINDADAAGLAETRFGAGADAQGMILVVTLGTGIGTALFSGGHLVPNTEFGHLMIGDEEAEEIASARAKVEDGLDWNPWSKYLRSFLSELERLMWPDLIIVGGGISEEFARFCEQIRLDTPVVPAALGNDAGIVGAALAATGSTWPNPRWAERVPQ